MNVEVGILTVITFLPLVGALVVAVLPTTWTRPVALGFALATWVVSLLLLVGYLPGRAGNQFLFLEAYDWIPIFGIQYKLGVDGLSAALVVLTTTLTWICILATWEPIQTRIMISTHTRAATQVVVRNFFFRFGCTGAPHWPPSRGSSWSC